jgi:uncharacterized membrane protein YkvA (DUF1232 family)
MALSIVSAARWALQFPKTALLASRLFLDTRVSSGLKLAAALAAILIVSPLDLLGDIPILGPIDDIALLMLLVNVFVRLCPDAIVKEHRGDVGYDPGMGVPDPSGVQIKNITPK